MVERADNKTLDETFIYPEDFFKERVLICLKDKVNCLYFPLNLSAFRCQNVLRLKEVLAILHSPSHSAVFSSSGPGCLLFMFHCVPVHRASPLNWLAQQKLSRRVAYKQGTCKPHSFYEVLPVFLGETSLSGQPKLVLYEQV